MKIQLTICYFGKVDPALIDFVKKSLRSKFKIPVLLGTEIKLPEQSFNKFRQQYEANIILDHLEKNFDEKVLAITDKDIYTSGLNYVFGLAKLKGKAAIVSIFRLMTEDKELLKERLIKETIHEFGHVLGLQHCKEKGCVMNFSNNIRDIDNKTTEFCHMCQIALGKQ